MPRLATLGNVEVRVYFRDTDRHKEPHFHAVSPTREILVSVVDFRVLEGSLGAADRRRVMSWAASNKTLLVQEWNRCNPQQPIAGREP